MSKTGIWVTIGIIAIVILGGWWYMSRGGSPSQTAMEASGSNQYSQVPGNSNAAPATGAASNAGLNASLGSVDSSIQSADSASASANSFSDTPVQQTE